MGTWTCEFVFTGRCVSRMICIFYLALVRVALLGVCWRGVFYSHNDPSVSSTGGIFPLAGFILFYNVHHPTPWTFRKISRCLLRSWGFPFDCSCPTFLEEDSKLSEKLMIISTRDGGFIPSDILVSLCYCFWVAVHTVAFLWRCFCGIFLIP